MTPPTPPTRVAVFKAYDVRGIVPDQIDEALARRTGAAFVPVVGADDRRGRPRHAPQLAGARGGVRRRRGRRRRRRRDDRSRLDRPALLRLRPPRPPRRDVHRQPQPRAVQRDQAVPRRRPADRRRHRAPRDPRRRLAAPSPTRSRVPGEISQRDVLDDYAAHLLSLAPVAGSPAQGRRRRRQRDGRAHRAGRLRPDRRRGRPGADVLRARRHLPAPRGQPDRAGEPRRPPAARPRRGRRHRARLRRRRRPLLRRRRARRRRVAVHADRADRGARAGQVARARR